MIKQDKYSLSGGMNFDLPPSVRGKDQYVMLRNGRIRASYQDALSSIPLDGRVHCNSANELLFDIGDITSTSNAGGNLTIGYTINGVSNSRVFAGKSNQQIVDMNASLPTHDTKILSAVESGQNTYILTTALDSSNKSIDAVWSIDSDLSIKLEFIGRFEWNLAENIDVVVNVETDDIIKIYIADGIHQVLSFKLNSSEDIDKPAAVL